MKLKSKIIAIFLLVVSISVIFCLNSVEAVGRVSQGWIQVTDTGERALMFRTFTSPDISLVKSYDGRISAELLKEGNDIWSYTTASGATANSKWVYAQPPSLPNMETFNTVNMIFHSEPRSNYGGPVGADASKNWYYSSTSNPIGLEIVTIADAYDSATAVATNPVLSNGSIETYLTISQFVGNTQRIDYGTGEIIKNVTYNEAITYRWAIINFGSGNVYVEDSFVVGDNLTTLIAKLAEANTDTCYVTEELISQLTGSNDSWEISRTAEKFMQQYGYHNGLKLWSASVQGREGRNRC